MARRLRDHPREFARRKELERLRAEEEGRPFDLKTARGHSGRSLRKKAQEAARRLFYEIINLVKRGADYPPLARRSA
jgi:hypothetical protein